MPYTKEAKREYDRQWYLKNREKKKEYYLKNIEKISQHKKEYHNKNREKILKQQKEYNKTEKGKKSYRISHWKQRGILCFDYNLLYDIFLSTNKCEFCNVLLQGIGRDCKCLDHDHSITDKFNVRGVLCKSCNNKDVLRENIPTS